MNWRTALQRSLFSSLDEETIVVDSSMTAYSRGVTGSAAKHASQQMTKAGIVAEKDRVIILAARENFFRDGYAGASMDAIAASAGVSVKTVYSHFSNKDQLFAKVMIAAAAQDDLVKRFPWFQQHTKQGVRAAGCEYLAHLLSEEQLALYRAVTRDAIRFPELGQQYHRTVAMGRTSILTSYFERLFRARGWTKRSVTQDSMLYEGILRAGIFEAALHGLTEVNRKVLQRHASRAADILWKLFTHSER